MAARQKSIKPIRNSSDGASSDRTDSVSGGNSETQELLNLIENDNQKSSSTKVLKPTDTSAGVDGLYFRLKTKDGKQALLIDKSFDF